MARKGSKSVNFEYVRYDILFDAEAKDLLILADSSKEVDLFSSLSLRDIFV